MADTNFSAGTVIASTWLDDVNTSTYAQLTSVAGTNTITATGPLSMSAYAVGQRFFFIPAANNTGAVTINISGLGVKAITKFGFTSLVAQDLLTGVIAEMAYDGTEFQLINPQTFNLTQIVPVTNGGTGATTASQALINLGATGRLIGVQTFTANGTYTPTAGTTRVLVKLIGGGGGGGGSAATAAGQVSVGAGGGSGGYAESFLTSGFSGLAVTIGAAGGVAAGGNGGPGIASSFGGLMTANGGGGGFTSAAGGAATASGGVAGTATGGNIRNTTGQRGESTYGVFSVGLYVGGGGGSSEFGFGGGVVVGSSGVAAVGLAASGFGAGGSGSTNAASAAANAGGVGTPGVCYIYEYS